MPSYAPHEVTEGQPAAASPTVQSVTAIVLLNWNGSDDTIACIESLLKLERQDFFIVVCDNLSADGSFERLRGWGESAYPASFATWDPRQQVPANAKIVLIQTGANLGFAGGCNVGVRFALLHAKTEFLWLLNNDTVVDKFSLGFQLDAMQRKPRVGILGSTLIYYDEPDRLQTAGGYAFNFWTARVLAPWAGKTLEHLGPEQEIEKELKYVSGASMFIRRIFVEQIGLLNEQYFLYFEEVDWAIRGRSRFELGYCAASRILHKEGRSIGSHRKAEKRSEFSELYLARNRVLFLKTYFPMRLPVSLLWIAGVGMLRLLCGRGRLAWTLWKGALRGLRTEVKPLPVVASWPASMK